MSRFKAPEQAESSGLSSITRAVRSRIAMFSLIGAAALPITSQACKFSLNFDINTAEGCRVGAVDKDGTKIISVPNMDAMFVLGKYEIKVKDEDETRIKGLLNISELSPLQTLPENIREIELPKDAYPWIRMVVEKSGRITLRADGDKIALNFNCAGLGQGHMMTCHGREIDPKLLDEEISQATEKYEAARMAAINDAGADATTEVTTDAGDADAGTTKTDAIPQDAATDTDAGDADAGTTKTEDVPQNAEVDRATFLNLINAERKKRGVKPVEFHQCPSSMAEYWAKKPGAAAGGHVADGETPLTRLQLFECKSPVMENVAYPNQVDAAQIFDQWKKSEKHLANMVHAGVKKIGLHCVSGTKVESGNFCVLDGTGD